jgi:uncharacterized protein YlzI (FlbEa/FlbD family)
MRNFVRVNHFNSGPVILGVSQIASIEPTPERNNRRCIISLSNGCCVETSESIEAVLEMIDAATEPATVAPPAQPSKPTVKLRKAAG